MGERTEIFRPEALEHRERGDAGGSVIAVSSRWTTTAFWALLVLVLAALVAASVVHVDRYARGTTAAAPGGRLVVLVPAALAPGAAPGRPVDVAGSTTRVVAVGTDVLYPDEVARRYGADVAIPSIAITTAARAGDSVPGTARVLVESNPLIVALVPGLKGLLGEDGG